MIVHRRDAENAEFTQRKNILACVLPQRLVRLCGESTSMRGLLKLSFAAFLTLVSISCGAVHREAEPDSSQPSETLSVEDTGKRLSGDYDVKTFEDDYAKKTAQGARLTTFRFREDGSFTIERELRDSVSSIEEGAYVIGKQGELVLYVEKAGGEVRSEARVVRYLMSDQSDNSMKLQSSPSAVLILQKR